MTEPDAPELLLPEDGLEICDTTPTFVWTTVYQAHEYELEVDDNDSFTSPEVSVAQANNTYTPTQALSRGTYYWRVNGRNEFFTSPWSSTWRVVILDVPRVPLLVFPRDGALIDEWPPTLTWEIVDGAASYRLRVDDSSDFLTPLVDLERLLETSYVPASIPTGIYYWHVAADNTCGAGEWSTSWSFSQGWQVSIPLVLRSD